MENQIFLEKNISKAYFKLAIPLVFSMVVTLIYNLADTYFVAQTSNTYLVAGVSLGAPIFTILMAIGNIFGQGGSSLMSRLLGSKEIEGAKSVSAFCFYASLAIGFIISVIMLGFQNLFIQLLGGTSQTYKYLSSYYRCLSIGAPMIILSFIHSNLLRSEGKSKESMLGTIIGAILNVILDPIFIFEFDLGASGAAIATVLGYMISNLYYLYVVRKNNTNISISIKDLKIPFLYIQSIIAIGVPAAIVNVMQGLSVIIMNQFLINYGNDKVAAMGIAVKVGMIALLLLTGLVFGGQPLFGYYYGSNDKNRLKKLLHFSFRFISAIALFLTIIIYVSAPYLMEIFMDNVTILKEGIVMLRWQIISMVFVGIILLITILFQSSGKAIGSFLLSVCRQGVIFIVVLLSGNYFFGYSGIIASQAIADTITLFVALLLFYHQLYKELY